MTTPIALVTGGSRGLGRSIALHSPAAASTSSSPTAAADEAGAVVAQIERPAHAPWRCRSTSARAARLRRLRRPICAALSRSAWQRDRFDFLVNNAGVGVPRGLRRDHRGAVRRADARPPQGTVLPDPGAAAADRRRRPHRQRVDRPGALRAAGLRRLRRDEGRRRGADALPGQGARPARHRGQHGRAGRHRDRLRRRRACATTRSSTP